MITSSLHNHCTYCDGKDTPVAMLVAASMAGITDFGLSSHSYCDFDPTMSMRSERKYINRINKLKRENTLKTRLYLGAEEDYFAPVKFRDEYDYIIGSVHFVPAGSGLSAVDISAEILRETADKFYSGDGYRLIEEYYRYVIAEANRKPDILGHFDLIKRYGSGIADLNSNKYREIAVYALDDCLKTNVIFEVNYGGTEKRAILSPYPDAFLLKRICERRGRVTVSTDCHDRALIANGLHDGERYLASLGFSSITIMRNGQFTEEKIHE